MDQDPSKSKGWETLTLLPFDEKIKKICTAEQMPDFIKGVSETVHNRTVSSMAGEGEMCMGLPRLDENGDGFTLNETIWSRFKGGWLEVSRRCSIQDADNKECERTELKARHFMWTNQEKVEWKVRKGTSGNFEDYAPTEKEVADFRAKCIEAMVNREEVKRRQVRQKGKRAIVTLKVRDNLL